MATYNYSPPLDQLLTLGHPDEFKDKPDYLGMGFTEEHIPDLIRMATDRELHWEDSESLEVWAPLHAWRTLGQLKATSAIEPLMNLWHEYEDDDWAEEELKEMFAEFGAVSIPYLKSYLADPVHGVYPRVSAAETLAKVGEKHPETRDECAAILTAQLEKYQEQSPEMNAFIIWGLTDVKAAEAAPLIEKVYEAKLVDKTIIGNWYSVQVQLGLQPPNPELERDPEVAAYFEERFGDMADLIVLLQLKDVDPNLAYALVPAILERKEERDKARQKNKAKKKAKRKKH
jgi:hypothetical protein